MGVEMVLDDNLIEQLSDRDLDIERLLTVRQQPLEEKEETGFILNTVNGRNIRETGLKLEKVNGKPITELVETYQNIGISQSDLNSAFSAIEATKKEREQSKIRTQNRDTKDNIESR